MKACRDLRSFYRLCQNCDITGSEKKIGVMDLEKCEKACLADKECKGYDYGKNGREGECYLNYDQGTDTVGHGSFDAWTIDWSGMLECINGEAPFAPPISGHESAVGGPYVFGNGWEKHMKACRDLRSFYRLCQNCDITGSEKKIGVMDLEKCEKACLADKECKGYDYGKNGREGECYLNYDQGTDTVGHGSFDA